MNEQTILERAQADEEGTHQRIAQLQTEIAGLEQHLDEIRLFRTMLAVYMREPAADAPARSEAGPADASPHAVAEGVGPLIEELREQIRNLHHCDAVWVEAVRVVESVRGESMWEGEVYVFDLIGSDETQRAYAWVQPTRDLANRQYFVMLHRPPVESPQMAVRAAIVGQYRGNHERSGQ
jgi:hypothetical protein